MIDSLIHTTALCCQGAAGPSGLDAHAWYRLCTAFKSASASLCQSLWQESTAQCWSLLHVHRRRVFKDIPASKIALYGVKNHAFWLEAKSASHAHKQDPLPLNGSGRAQTWGTWHHIFLSQQIYSGCYLAFKYREGMYIFLPLRGTPRWEQLICTSVSANMAFAPGKHSSSMISQVLDA